AEVQQKKSMKKTAFKKAVDELQKKAIELQEKYQKEAAKIMMATNSATEQIDNLALEQTQAVAKEQGYDVVLAMPVTLYVSETVDMTDAVIQALNKKAVKINYPDPDTLTPPQNK
ncbi:MAG: OmpH family outer membrane protein, partial [Alphaproteobacteria bacterium]|nr:OmpH family outer membrane protein [Alphaproteobacteria bacterium]